MSDQACENIAPHVVSLLSRQLRQLATSPPEGITLIPSDSMSEILADIAGPEKTPYEGGKFRVKLVLGSDYPAAPPKGYFISRIFHPNISATGDICVNTLKRDWKPENTLSHVLQVIRCLLIVPFPESSLNEEAGKLFMESYDEYAKKAKFMTSLYATVETGNEENQESADDAATSIANSQQAKAPLSAGRINTSIATVSSKSSAASESVAKIADRKKKSLRRL